MGDKIERRKREFDEHIWDHTKDPFQKQFEVPTRLSPKERNVLVRIINAIKEGRSEEEVVCEIEPYLRQDSQIINALLRIAGITRNKMLTDLRSAYGYAPSQVESLVSSEIWSHASRYLVQRLENVLKPLALANDALESLNWATWHGWIRQARAKRQGHEAERRLAQVFDQTGIPFEPRSKLTQPLSADAQVANTSFDLVVPDERHPLVCFKSTVHTSNIGQYGQSKDSLEIEEARSNLESYFGTRRPKLIALIDGVGFRSNRRGLERILEIADEFCQFRTIWKAVLICAWLLEQHNIMRLKLRVVLPRKELAAYKEFLESYRSNNVSIMEDSSGAVKEASSELRLVSAGDALIYVQ